MQDSSKEFSTVKKIEELRKTACDQYLWMKDVWKDHKSECDVCKLEAMSPGAGMGATAGEMENHADFQRSCIKQSWVKVWNKCMQLGNDEKTCSEKLVRSLVTDSFARCKEGIWKL